MTTERLIQVNAVSKKFCRSLRKSLRYGLTDLRDELRGRRHGGYDTLRSEEFWAVKDVSFELKRGECIGLIGHNGAGKSTLLKMLNGLIKPDQGTIAICGRVGALIELGAGFNPILTGRENIYINGQVLGFSKKEVDRKLDAILEFADIGEFVDMPVKNYSSGMKVRLGFAVAAQMEPDVLLVDEVLAVGDIGFRVKCLNRVQELLERSAVILVSHAMPMVARVCTSAMVLSKGQTLLHTSDVGEAIDVYYQGFDTGEQRMFGSGEVVIESVSCNGASAAEALTVRFGAPLTVVANLTSKATCKSLALRLIIWNQDQRPVVDVMADDWQQFTWENAGEQAWGVQISIPALNLSAGKHSVTVGIYDPEGMRVLCRLDNAAAFVMGQHTSTACDTLLQARFRVQSESMPFGGGGR